MIADTNNIGKDLIIMKPAVHRIGVFTSGGDAPGMNAAIRAVVRAALYYGIDCIGIRRGYHGLLNGDFTRLNFESVSDISRRRSEERRVGKEC